MLNVVYFILKFKINFLELRKISLKHKIFCLIARTFIVKDRRAYLMIKTILLNDFMVYSENNPGFQASSTNLGKHICTKHRYGCQYSGRQIWFVQRSLPIRDLDILEV